MHARHTGPRGRAGSSRRRVAGAALAMFAVLAAPAARAQPSGAPPTCRAEVADLDTALQRAQQPGLCERCAERLARTLESLYTNGVLPSFYQSAGQADWSDPQRRPAMLSGVSLAGQPDGPDLLADIDSGYGPRGSLRLRYTTGNRPLAVTTSDRAVTIAVTRCVAAAPR